MGKTVALDIENGLATLRLGRAHGNAINSDLVDDLTESFRRADADPAVRGVLLASAGKLFCPGLDLRELIELDRGEMAEFLGRFSECILTMYTFGKPLVAAIHGHAVAGGCVLTLTADWRVLREGALVGLNEVKVGVSFPFGVAMLMRESVPIAHLEEVALFGWNYEGHKALAVGLAHELHGDDGFEAYCRGRLEELAARDPRAFAVSKRYLRSATVERMRQDGAYAEDFLESWFSPATRAKVTAIVEGLRNRGG